MYTIPVYSYPDTKMSVRLDGDSYILRYRSNSEEDSVSLEIQDSSGKPILCGVKIVPGLNLIGGVNVEGLPNGSLFFVNSDLRDRVSAFGFSDGSYLLYTSEYYDDIFELEGVVADES